MATTKVATRKKRTDSRKPAGTAPQGPPRLRLDKVTFEGFKAFEKPFTLEIPPPTAEGDLDVLVLGGVNGTGKTSVLEGICWALLPDTAALWTELEKVNELVRREWVPGFAEVRSPEAGYGLLINANREYARVQCHVRLDGGRFPMDAKLPRRSSPTWEGATDVGAAFQPATDASLAAAIEGQRAMLTGSAEPVLVPPILYFHSYRRIPERNPELAELGDAPSRGVSNFKRIASRAVIASLGGLENQDRDEARRVLDQLDGLLERLVGGRIKEQMRSDGNRLGLLVERHGRGEPIPFDALSSGQKQIVSTLFLIWEHSRKQNCIVLIDEPELHLHREWHGEFMRQLAQLAPRNQYIIATHSAAIARAVEPGRVILLEP
jgi:ABC-type uncharacterized transport system ATPase component